jgi:hypothetical protein
MRACACLCMSTSLSMLLVTHSLTHSLTHHQRFNSTNAAHTTSSNTKGVSQRQQHVIGSVKNFWGNEVAMEKEVGENGIENDLQCPRLVFRRGLEVCCNVYLLSRLWEPLVHLLDRNGDGAVSLLEFKRRVEPLDYWGWDHDACSIICGTLWHAPHSHVRNVDDILDNVSIYVYWCILVLLFASVCVVALQCALTGSFNANSYAMLCWWLRYAGSYAMLCFAGSFALQCYVMYVMLCYVLLCFNC